MRSGGFGALLVALIIGIAGTTAAQRPDATGEEKSLSKTCFCIISSMDLTSMTGHGGGTCLDLTATVNLSWSPTSQPLSQQARETACWQACAPLVSQAATDATKRHAIEQCACAKNAPQGRVVRGWRAVGNNGHYVDAGTIGMIQRVVPGTAVKCPSGWLANPTNVDGGVTSDGRCKKATGTLSISPPPPNGTQLGTYGFSWGNGMYAWGTTANGGAAVPALGSAASCNF